MTARVVKIGERLTAFIENVIEAHVAQGGDMSCHLAGAPPIGPAAGVSEPGASNRDAQQATRNSPIEVLGALARDHIATPLLCAWEKEHDVHVGVKVDRRPDSAHVEVRLYARRRIRSGQQAMLVARSGVQVDERIFAMQPMEWGAKWFDAVDAALKDLREKVERQRVVSIQDVLV